MNLKQKKKLYESEPDKWVVYSKRKNPTCVFKKQNELIINDKLIVRLIHKDHEEIADAVIANPDIQIEYRWHDEDWMHWSKNFFQDYEHQTQYQLKPHGTECMPCRLEDEPTLRTKEQIGALTRDDIHRLDSKVDPSSIFDKVFKNE